MNKVFTPLLKLSLLGILPVLLSCEAEALKVNEEPVKTSNYTIERNSLVGHWELTEMKSDTLVDLNQDGTGSTNLMDETSCFNTTSITFFEDGTLETVNSRLDFNAGTDGGEFACMNDRTDYGTWDVEDDVLIMNMEINGETYTDRKKIEQESDSFSFDISKFESDQYVNDPGDTVASEIEIVSLKYSRQ